MSLLHKTTQILFLLFLHPTPLTSISLFHPSTYQTILTGKIAIIPNFLSSSQISTLRSDAISLYRSSHFSTDALASYGTTGKFDPSTNRAVLKLSNWKDATLGSWSTRKEFGNMMAEVRADLARNLERPGLVVGDSVSKYGDGSTEISYTRFGPGSYLKRHIDEHHEELKGKEGWSRPTRRSVSWLIYLNEEDWDAKVDGGELRVFQRKVYPPSNQVGARKSGDLQIGWLRPSSDDKVDRPVFLDGHFDDEGGRCAMYIDAVGAGSKTYITDAFSPHPILFTAGSEYMAQKLLIHSPTLSSRFRLLEAPKTALDGFMSSSSAGRAHGLGESPAVDELATNIAPTGGTLVLFDSVSLPHEVLLTKQRERWATSGWFHEDQQAIPKHFLS